MSGNVGVGHSRIGFTVSIEPLLRLATELHALGVDFYVPGDPYFGDPPRNATDPLTARPPASWTWADCHRSIHWGLAKLGVGPDMKLNDALLPLADGTVACLPAAAAVLESVAQGARCVLPLLAVMRVTR